MEQSKERLIQTQTQEVPRQVDLVDVGPKEVPLPREVKTWMEKLEEDKTLAQQTITDDSTGQTVMKPAAPADPTVVVLPVTRTAFTNGFKKTVGDAGKWLSTFIFRLVKIKKGKVKFKEEQQ